MQIKRPESVKPKTKEYKLTNSVNWQGAFPVERRKRMDGCVTV
jgi:hypothetical protein